MAEDTGKTDRRKAVPESLDVDKRRKAVPQSRNADDRRKAVLRYLGRPREIEKQIRRKKEKIRDLRSSLTSISVNYSDMPKNPSGPASRMEEAMVKVVDLEGEIEDLVEYKEKRMADIIKTIGFLQDSDEQRILIALFVKDKTWDEAVEDVGFGRRKFSELRNAGINALCSQHIYETIITDQVEDAYDEERMQGSS